MKTSIFSLLAALLLSGAVIAQQSGNTMESSNMVGGMSKTEFERINKEGAAKVAAIKASKSALSAADKDLMMQVAMGGMQQLLISQTVLQKASNEQIRELAQAEVEEQTGLSAKLKEIAAAKGIELPTQPDADTQAMLSRYQELSGEEVDRYYVAESGVKGHEKLDKVMSSVESKAKDSNLKSLAAAAHPLVRTHLQVSKATLEKMTSATGNK